jgi:ureidoacrylate peracid hydrolase
MKLELIPPDIKIFKTLKEKIDPKHTAVICVDMQKEFLDPKGKFARLQIPGKLVSDVTNKIEKFLDAARNAGVLIIYTKEIDDPKFMSEAMWERLYRKGMELYCLSDSPAIEIIDQLAPKPGDEVIIKHRFSSFYETDLDMLLRSKKIKTLVMTGTQTNVCVDSTAKDGYFHGYHIVMVADCLFTYDPIAHQKTLETIEEAFGVVSSFDEILGIWKEMKP